MKRLQAFISLIFLFILFILSAQGQPIEIRVLHVNDFHGFATPYKPLGSDELYGGIAYLAARVNELRREKPTLLLSAGDMIQGSNWANLFRGESVIKLMNQMKFDAMVIGNHEFDFGLEVLRKRISEAKFPVLGANIKGLNSLKPYSIKEIKGVRVGMIVVITEDTPLITHPRSTAGVSTPRCL